MIKASLESAVVGDIQFLLDKAGEGFVTLTAIHPEGTHPTPSRHIPMHDDKALERALKRLSAANERGFCANPLIRAKRMLTCVRRSSS